MNLKHNGNVGIGTTSPGNYKLNVNGSGSFSDTLSAQNSGSQMVGLWRSNTTSITGTGSAKISLPLGGIAADPNNYMSYLIQVIIKDAVNGNAEPALVATGMRGDGQGVYTNVLQSTSQATFTAGSTSNVPWLNVTSANSNGITVMLVVQYGVTTNM